MLRINEGAEGASAHAHIVAPAGLNPGKPNWRQQIKATYGVPRELVIDNGREFLGAQLMTALADLGITVKATPASTLGYKPTAEALLRELTPTIQEAP